MQREDKHVSMARSMEDSNVLIKYKGTTTMDETAESFPPPKGETGAPKHTSNDLEGVRVAPDSIPTSQGRSMQEDAMLAPQAIVVGGLQAQEAPPNQVSPVWTSRKFPIVPGYHLPSNIEYGDPTEDDERFTFTIAGDIPMNVPPALGAVPRSRRRRRRRGNTPRVVGATNVEHTQPAPAKSPELPLSPGFAESSRLGRVPGATNDNSKRRRRRRRKRNVGATGSGDDVGSERGDDVSCQPAQDN
jgi:hypothetical protein